MVSVDVKHHVYLLELIRVLGETVVQLAAFFFNNSKSMCLINTPILDPSSVFAFVFLCLSFSLPLSFQEQIIRYAFHV